MSFSLVYLLQRFVFRVWQFVRDWYRGGFRVISHAAIRTLESLDRTIALRVTLRHFFEPLYGDRTTIGYTLGIPFRLARVLIALALYLFIFAFALFVFVLWALLPFFVFFWNDLSFH